MWTRNRLFFACAAGCLCAAAASPSLAVPVQWSGNGHWYELVPNDGRWATWQQARDFVQTNLEHEGFPADLTTITSPEEQAFVETLTTEAWTGWLGGYQEPAGYPLKDNWHWIGQWEGTPYEQAPESWDYTNWLNAEPNFSWEDGLSIYLNHGDPPGGWNDAARNGTNSYGYDALVEYVPEPATLTLLALGGSALVRRRRRVRGGKTRKPAAVCA